ncbi:MAG: hypothetical protein AB3N12_11905 [Ruegeria sp.]
MIDLKSAQYSTDFCYGDQRVTKLQIVGVAAQQPFTSTALSAL